MSAAFSIAPAGERTLAADEYLLGCLLLAAIVGPLVFAAWRLRRALLPSFSGAPARLVESILALALAIWLAEILGTFSAFTTLGMVLASVGVAVVVALLASRLGRGRGGLIGRGRVGPRADSPRASVDRPRAGPGSSPSAWIPGLAALAVAGVVAAWAVPTLGSLAAGMDRADTLWYHMPLSARFAQTAELGSIDHFDPIFFAAYYPANSEVLHAIPLLAFERDFLSPLLNLGFLALSLLASYCIGRPWGLGPQALIGGSIALGSQMLIEFQAGEALNDIVGVAFVLAAVAVLLSARETPVAGKARPRHGVREVDRGMGVEGGGTPGWRPAVVIAGIAAGLAAGTKLSFLAPVVALFVGLVVVARGRRLRTAALFALPALAAGGYWYARNLVAVGNPIPYTTWGPLGLPAPERTLELRPGFSVAHYFGDPEVWVDWFVPALNESLGVLWPLTLVAVIGAGALALARGGEPLVRVLGAVVLFTVLAYLFTPLTAAGEEGMPIAFEWNVRYVAPAAAIALALLPCLPAARASESRRRWVSIALGVLLTATLASLVQWQQGHVKGAVAAGVSVLVAFALLRRLAGRGRLGPGAPRAWAVGLAACALLGALAAGWWEQRHYLERRYENTSPELRLAGALRWARDLRDARVAVAGIRGVFNQYPFLGTDLSNHVEWLGEEGEEGAYLRIASCERWRAELAAGRFTHVVTTYDPYRPGSLTDTKEALWTREDPAARQVFRDGPVSVFELRGAPDPGRCEGLPNLSRAELDGESVNAEPTANQPPPGAGS